MNKFFKNPWAITIGGGLIVLLMWKYLLPILPEGKTALKYVLVVIAYLLTWGASLFSSIIVYKYHEFNKLFVLKFVSNFVSVYILIILDMFSLGYYGTPFIVNLFFG